MGTSIVVLRFARTPPPLCHSRKDFFSFCSGNGGGIAMELFAILPAASKPRRSTKHTSDWQWRLAVRCLLLTANAADNNHHTLAQSLSMFETSSHKTDRRHPTPFPNTNEVECMPTTSLHDLLDSMHNTLSQLQIAAGRACDVIYSPIWVSSPCPGLLAMLVNKHVASIGLRDSRIPSYTKKKKKRLKSRHTGRCPTSIAVHVGLHVACSLYT